MITVCQTCGDIGFEEALVYCDSCKIEAIHRYCVGITPVPFTEYITWICEDCDGSDSDSNCKEVDQTAKLGNVIKKSDKKKKKKKKKKSSNVEAMEVSTSPIKEHQCHTAKPVLAEDHGLQDATNVEAMEVSSSPIKETMKESKRRESSDSGNSHELTGLVRNGASILEARDSSSVPDHNSCTSKGSESRSVHKEVDQTDKLTHMSKKNEKEKKKKKKKKKTNKKKNNKMSSNHTTPVLAVDDHGVQDATNVEPGKVSSSRIKQIMESKRRESSDSGKPHDLTGLARNEASVSEAEKPYSVSDHRSCASKRNDSESDRKEVGQTAKLGHISKKNGKKKKKKKKKTSSSHSPPVLAAEDNELQDVANVEPVKVSSSPIKETGKKISGSRKSLELTGLVGNGNSSNMPDDNSCTSKKRKSSSGNIQVTSENRQLAPGNISCKEAEPNMPDDNFYTSKKRKSSSGNIQVTSENRQLASGNIFCNEAEPNMPQKSAGLTYKHYRAQPIKTPKWRGLISVKGGNICSIDGIVAHVSSLACLRVHDTASSLHTHLSAEMLPRLKIWPRTFLKNAGPTDESIALYFFPSSESNDEKVFHSLVLEMKKNDYAMRCVLDHAELLLFTSYMLPMDSWTFNSKEYLWGIFRPRQTSRH